MADPNSAANPRYLVPFHPKRIPHHFVDVLIVGGGIAGLRAAMACDPRLTVLIVTKDHRRESNSSYAQGGIAGVLDPADDFANHVRDTQVAGAGLCDTATVDMVVREAPHHIRELIEWGARFDESDDGELELGREGGHSHNRIAHALGDATGKEIMRAMWRHARETLRAQVWENTFTIDLLTTPGGGGPECRGALVWNPHHGKTFVWAKQTVLATGGAGQIYRETTNPPVATGDGHAIAFRAGAELADMEFMQFHPTVLYIAGSSRSLITEAMRGEGALARGLQRRALHARIRRARRAGAPRHREPLDRPPDGKDAPSRVSTSTCGVSTRTSSAKRFPGIAKMCREFGLDIATDRDPGPARRPLHDRRRAGR